MIQDHFINFLRSYDDEFIESINKFDSLKKFLIDLKQINWINIIKLDDESHNDLRLISFKDLKSSIEFQVLINYENNNVDLLY